MKRVKLCLGLVVIGVFLSAGAAWLLFEGWRDAESPIVAPLPVVLPAPEHKTGTDLIPGHYSALESKVVGILVAGGASVSVHWVKNSILGFSPSFSTAGDNYRGVHFPGEYPFGVSEGFTLVEVEVNNGEGSPQGKADFVATKVRVLDGTAEYPLKTEEVITKLSRVFAEYSEHLSKETRVALQAELAKARQGDVTTGISFTKNGHGYTELTYVTWIPETERLRVVFITSFFGDPIEVKEDSIGKDLVTYGVAWGMIYETDKTGRLLNTVPTALERFAMPRFQRKRQ